MIASLTEAQIAQLFEQISKYPITEGLKELRKAMQPAQKVKTSEKRVVHRVILTNGTRQIEWSEDYAKLERGPY